jgi:hypothetical protein
MLEMVPTMKNEYHKTIKRNGKSRLSYMDHHEPAGEELSAIQRGCQWLVLRSGVKRHKSSELI